MVGSFINVQCRPCTMCGKVNTVRVPKAGFDKWRTGALIQNVLPEVSKEDRELLISGTCPPCFDKLFRGIEDEE